MATHENIMETNQMCYTTDHHVPYHVVLVVLHRVFEGAEEVFLETVVGKLTLRHMIHYPTIRETFLEKLKKTSDSFANCYTMLSQCFMYYLFYAIPWSESHYFNW